MKIVQSNERMGIKKTVDAGTGTKQQREAVLSILEDVQHRGDTAVFDYTERFDNVRLTDMKVSRTEIEAAYTHVHEDVIVALNEAKHNIRRFHEQQKRTSWMTTEPSGTVLGQMIRPLAKIGAYVPGGTAAYPSSVLMTIIPAQVAGVEEIVITTPPDAQGNVSPGVIVAADLLGVSSIYKVGGAQAIGALAYGTETIPAVDKIVGPGNIYVALAKREVFGIVDIDMVAGPSDITVLADKHQNPIYVAADLLSQAEHDPLSAAICVTTSHELAEQVQQEVEKQLLQLPRQEIARASINNHGTIYVAETMDEAINIVNDIAPEHLEVLVQEPFELVGKIKNAGAIFLGPYSTEPVGDYFAGPNHVLPTSGTARFSSPLNVDDFMKKSSIIHYSRHDLQANGEAIMRLAEYEGLQGHAQAIQYRLDDFKNEKECKFRRRGGTDE